MKTLSDFTNEVLNESNPVNGGNRGFEMSVGFDFTTLALGEEDETTQAVGEEDDFTTMSIGEEV